LAVYRLHRLIRQDIDENIRISNRLENRFPPIVSADQPMRAAIMPNRMIGKSGLQAFDELLDKLAINAAVGDKNLRHNCFMLKME